MPVMLAALGHVYARSGDQQRAQTLLLELRNHPTEQYISSFCMAIICAGLGDADAMFNWLGKSYEERSSWLFAIKVEPMFHSSRSDPRFIDLTERVGLPAIK
jgi:hypothetical protein